MKPHCVSNMIPVLGILLTRLIVVFADCNLPPVIEDAHTNLTGDSPFPEGHIIQYTCDVGYSFSGYSGIYKCVGGIWQGEAFRCIEKLCTFLDPPDNGLIVGEPDYTISSYINFACDPGYKFEGDERLRCRIDGWVPNVFKQECVPKDCGDFGDIQNGDAFQEAPDGVYNDYGSEVYVSCRQGFTLSGTAKVTCNEDGRWGKKPECKPFECEDYPGLNTSCIENAYLDDHLIMIDCIKDQDRVTKTGEDDYATCFQNEWHKKDVGCFCNCRCNSTRPNVVLNNCNTGGYVKHGRQLDWQCSYGHSKQRTGQISCYDGKFSAEPVCLVYKCEDFGEVPNGNTVAKYKFGVKNSVGSTVEIQCDKGYTITGGSPLVECLRDMTWEEKPQCMKTQCPSYPVPPSQCIDNLEYNEATGILALQCINEADVSVTRIGPNSTKCIDKWEDTTMACYCDCKLKSQYDGVTLDHTGTQKNGILQHGSTLMWHCSTTHTKNSPNIKCNDGKLTSIPECNLAIPIKFGIGAITFLFVFMFLIITLLFCCSVWIQLQIKERHLNRRQTVWFCIKCGACKALKHERRPFTRCCGENKEKLKEETPLSVNAAGSEVPA